MPAFTYFNDVKFLHSYRDFNIECDYISGFKVGMYLQYKTVVFTKLVTDMHNFDAIARVYPSMTKNDNVS